jgi:sulfonate transport system permease protein
MTAIEIQQPTSAPEQSTTGDRATGLGAAAPATDDLHTPQFLGPKSHRRLGSFSARASVPVVILVAWWWGAEAHWFSPSIFSSPSQVLDALRALFDSGQLGQFIAASAQRMAIGVSSGLAVGFLSGVASGLSARGEQLIDPTMQAVRAVPFLALIPLFVAWFGVGETVKYVIIAFAAALPMYIYTYMGVRNVDRKVVEAARGFGLHGSRLTARVILPSAAPSLLMALRISLGVSLLGLIAAEQIGATAGIGYLVTLAQTYFRTDYMMLCIVIYACIGILIDLFVRLLEHVIMPWRRHVGLR